MKVEESGGAVAAKRRGEEARPRGEGGASVRRRTRWRVQADATAPARARARATPLQRLLAACRAAFGGPGTVPAPADVDLIRGILDKIGPEDVNLRARSKIVKATDAYSLQRNPTIITMTTMYKCRNFSIVIFFLPRGAVIPLHNHPGMTVFSKLLLGSMHVKSYDWADPPVVVGGSTPDDRLRLAKLVLDADLVAPRDALVLYPESGGNMHRFTAATPCAVLDILGPPYSENRDCTYYQDFPYSHHDPSADETGDVHVTDEQKARLGWLKETVKPQDLKMYEVTYRGPLML
ncbi:plant cysteine oxidase 2-like isoform X2 [Phragmites australis]|uniref:plant cysteine oxidase 2-like isoform X2 n=1 Tax=Phragmites australis TaxID=29695 RepID=UPI002D78B879|nr:plant cysteine oxidase 2-like isoform X2 [Phragmites australis]